jgi:hypothetical protein
MPMHFPLLKLDNLMACSPLRMFSLAGTFALLQHASAAPARMEQRIECPAEIPQESLPLARAPEGWSSSTRGGLVLQAVDLSYGPPSEMAFLKPQVVTARGKKSIYKWTELEVTSATGSVWVACNYGRSGNVILGKRLDDKVSECTSTDTEDKQGRYVIVVRCTLRP